MERIWTIEGDIRNSGATKIKILQQRTKLTITERISTINRGPRNLNARNLKSEISDQNWQLWEEFLLQMEAPET